VGKAKLKANWVRFVLWGLVGVYFLSLSFLTISRHRNYYSFRYDLGNMEQVIYNTSEGRVFEFTDPEGEDTVSRLKYHADFILVFLAPIYRLFPYTETLLIVQALVIALGAIPLFWLAKDVLKDEKLGLLVGGFYLLSPIVWRANLFDFHGVTFLPTIILFAFWYLYKKKYIWFFVFSIFSMFCKEQIPIAVILMTVWGMIRDRGFRKKGLIFSFLAGLYFLFTFFVLIPAFRTTGGHFVFKHFYSKSGGEAGYNREFLTDGRTYKLMLALLLPFGFLPVLAPVFLGFSLPDLAAKILSGRIYHRSIDFHYMASIIPFFFISFVFGLKKLFGLIEAKKIKRVWGIILVVVCFLISFCLWSPATSEHLGLSIFSLLSKRDEVDYIERLKREIGEEAGVCATNNLGAQFARRENLYHFPNFCEKADYILILIGYGDMVSEKTASEKVASLAADINYRKIGEYKNFVGFEKIK